MIYFDIAGSGPHTIIPTIALPVIRDAVIIDGTSEPDLNPVDPRPVVEIDGSLAGDGVSGLTIASGGEGSTIRGLVINRFDTHGIFVSRRDNVSIERNFLGTDPNGQNSNGNGQAGVYIINGANNTIRDNLISGNEMGVKIEGPLSTGNVIAGNLIGVNTNVGSGIRNRLVNVDIAGAPHNIVGGTGIGDGNVIAASRVSVHIRGARATGNLVQGNRIGTGVSATFSNRGVEIKNSASGNIVGGPGNAGNVISGNTKGVLLNGVQNNLVHGNKIGTNAAGDAARHNVRGVLISGGSNNQIGGQPNVISGNTHEGVRISGAGAAGNVVSGNFIGTNAAGDAAIPNGTGVLILPEAGDNNTIGGTTAAERNIISGNTHAGVALLAGGNLIKGNFIGTDVTGTSAVGNETGVLIFRSSGQMIGGAVGSGAGNVISGNTEKCVYITGRGAIANTIIGNAIGTDAAGTSAVANENGVVIESDANTVGGATMDDGNVISGNTQNGVYLVGIAATGNMIQSNRIGININGTDAVPNERSGVLFKDASNNTVGGTDAGNAIGGNLQQGIRITGAGSTGNLVQGNSIGFDVLTMAIIANRDGVRITDGASGNIIGGTAAASEDNEIAHNTDRGAWISDGTGNRVSQNSIHDNGAIGISLGAQGATPNDGDTGSGADADTGANNLQNFPVIELAALTGGNLDVQFLVDSTTGNSAYDLTVEFFLADAAGEEGQTYLGTVTYPAASATLSFSDSFAIPSGVTVNPGDQIVATATDGNGNTSEFSAAATTAAQLLANGGERSPESGAKSQELSRIALLSIADVAADRLIAAGFAADLVGLEDIDDPLAEDDLMYAWLEPGVRKTSLEASLADNAFAGF